MVSSSRSSPVLEAKQSLPIRSPVFENWADQMKTESSSPLVFGAAWETVTSHQRLFFMSLKAAILVELTSSVYLVTLKIAKSLVVFEFGSSFAAVVLCDVPLSVSAADIKMALGVFGEISCIQLRPAGIWQYVVVYFKNLDAATSALNHWSVLVGKNSVRILFLVNQQETIVSRDRFKAKLVNLLLGCTVFKISDIIFQVGGQFCFIPWSPNSGCCSHFALVTFGSQANLDLAVAKTGTLRKCRIWWETPGYQQCFKCQEVGHLAVDCKISPLLSPKIPKLFKSYFVDSVLYAKIFSPPKPSEFLLLVVFVPSSVAIDNSLLFSQLISLESDLIKFSALVEFIVKLVGSLVKVFEQFINRDLVSSSTLGFKVNEILVHISSFNKMVSKLGREVVSLKKKCCMENIDMSGNLDSLPVVNDEVFSNLMFLWEHKSVVTKTDSFKTAE
ncbi:hypothetical protein G9A89_000035 [Geosiphon pyriformis]|nr:hypothetical protein G9A89_000035 [Geosiphon pyriformis]